jgi:hypothetical protein
MYIIQNYLIFKKKNQFELHSHFAQTLNMNGTCSVHMYLLETRRVQPGQLKGMRAIIEKENGWFSITT